jgi:ATP-dependent RNA helicase RhlE
MSSLFSSFDLSTGLLDVIAAQGYEKPTPIQAQVIPSILAGKDLIGLAQTGTGKTAAYVIPVIEQLLNPKARKPSSLLLDDASADERGPASSKKKRGGILILVPTRELAEQVHEVVKIFIEDSNHSVACIYGGVRYENQIKKLKKGMSIVIACPGRLLDHLQRKTFTLDSISTLVLDEADQMFDMGFYPALQQIVKRVPRDRQTLMFSATMPSEIQQLAGEILNSPVVVELARRTPTRLVEHKVVDTKGGEKPRMLLSLLRGPYAESPVLVFARTKHTTKMLHVHLEDNGVTVTSLQGNLSQAQRARSMKGFRDGKFQVMVATDIAARGIDVPAIECVINYELPPTVETYIHRIGRTGRAEKKGTALSLVTREERFLLKRIEKGLGVPVGRETHEPVGDFVPPPSSRSLREGSRDESRGNGRKPSSSRFRGDDGERRSSPRHESPRGERPSRERRSSSDRSEFRQRPDRSERFSASESRSETQGNRDRRESSQSFSNRQEERYGGGSGESKSFQRHGSRNLDSRPKHTGSPWYGDPSERRRSSTSDRKPRRLDERPSFHERRIPPRDSWSDERSSRWSESSSQASGFREQRDNRQRGANQRSTPYDSSQPRGASSFDRAPRGERTRSVGDHRSSPSAPPSRRPTRKSAYADHKSRGPRADSPRRPRRSQ